MSKGNHYPRLDEISVAAGQTWLNGIVEFWNAIPKDTGDMAAFCTDDVEVHYADMPIIRGRAALQEMLAKRFATFTEYHLKKTVRMADGDKIFVDLDIHWTGTASNGEPRRTRAFEVLTFRDGYACKWELVSNPAPVDLP